MKILITGGAGFIGSNLCRSLCDQHDVICMDNLITGKKSNVDGLNVQFLKQDIRTPFDIKCDIIFNMASPASPADFPKIPLDILETNSFGVKNVLENAKKHNARVIHASTSETYGDPLEHPQKESYFGNVNTLGPRACYDESKRFAETICYNYHHKFGTEIILARIFNTYGERMRKNDGRVIPNFITQVLKNQDITIHGDGSQTRSFCYVSDMVDAFTKLAFSDIKFDVFNVGNPEELTVKKLATIISTICKTDTKLVSKPFPQDDPKKRKPDISKIKKILDWEPKIKLNDGLKKTIEWFKSDLA
ncbi:MAG: NAD-dependent epimerase/dehydratase family protein [Candidatus Micrarchaeota archaeon]|nr:NAD-dependent epimerase/dehydratase family protein [Candidatus Micrarchaeota archaeon]